MRGADMGSRTLGVAVIAALVATWAVGASAASAPKPVKSADPNGDVKTLDLTRVSLTRGSDGRLRASMTLAAAWDGKALLADAGPPGSVCLKAWTTTAPADTVPEYLVCVTADGKGALRGSVLHERANKLPERVAAAEVSRPSGRTVTLRFSQSALGSPARLAVAAESTRPGCTRVSCVDTAPDAPKTLTLTLRSTGT
jgi:hypothetical protein